MRGAIEGVKAEIGGVKALAEQQRKQRRDLETDYNRAATRYESAARSLRDAITFRNKEAERLWKPFQASAHSWFGSDTHAADEWNRVMLPANDAIEAARQRTQDAEQEYIRARDARRAAILPKPKAQPGAAQPASKQKPMPVPTAPEFKQLLDASGGSIERALEMWKTQHSPAGKL
jgi:hypothetical protein